MKLEDQLCTVRQGERLKEFGIESKSIFCYCVVDHGSYDGDKYSYEILPSIFELKSPLELATTHICDLFTVAELGVMLPDLIETKYQYELAIVKEDDCWLVLYARNNNLLDVLTKTADATEAQARAAMLIHLLETSLITSEEVNKRINQ